MRHTYFTRISLTSAFILCSTFLLAQQTEQKVPGTPASSASAHLPEASATTKNSPSLAVSGLPGEVPVIEMKGKSYVDIQSLARLTQGSLKFQGSQITLTLPGTELSKKKGFSKAFLDAGIEEMSVIREWRVVIDNAVQRNYPVTQDLVAGFQRNATNKLALASAAASTDDDRQGLTLLQTEFNNMQALSDKYVGLRSSLTYTPPDSIQNDPLNEQILKCAQQMASLAAGGTFENVISCY